MARNFPKEFIIIILCIVLIFISGLLLPRYLSKQYFQLRNELDSASGNFKYREQENLQHFEISLNSQNMSHYSSTIRSDVKAEIAQENSSDTVISPLNARAKIKKRSKRQALSDSDKFLAWNFSLNLLSQQDSNSHESVKAVPNSLDQNNFMGVALNAKGKGKQRTALSELQNALSSVKQFVTSFISKPRRNVTLENEFSQDKVVLDIESEKQTQNPDIVKFESDGSGDEPISPRRQPKFIFEMFGFGKKSIESTTNLERETTEVRRDSDMGVLKVPEVLIESTNTPKAANDAENDPEILNLQPESLVIKATNSEGMANTELSLAVTTEHVCSDNATNGCESLAHKNKTDFHEETPEAISPTKPLFTDNVLELFCMSLVNKVAESQHLFDSDEGNAFDSQHNTEKEQNQLRSSQNSSFLNLLNVFNSIQKNESPPVPDVIEDFVTESNDELMTDIDLSKRRESRFVNFGSIFGFGSGRSAISDESNSFENTENEDVIKLENLPSLLDCESYFRKKQNIKMFPKPNLMDMISDPKIQLVDFSNATISSKLQEQNLQFLTDLLKSNLNNTVDTFSKISGDTDMAKFKSENNLTSNKSALNDMVDDSEILNATESSDSHLNKPISTNASVKEDLHSSESQRAGKFINFLGFGSGFFGSGMRSSETSDSTESDSIEEFGSGEQFRKTDIQLQNVNESVSQERFFGFLGFGGSGDGRELAEDEKTTETGMPCDEDCMQLITEKSTDSDDDCNLENPLEDNGVEQFEGVISRNESNCDDDCLTNNTIDNSKTGDTVKNVLKQALNESTYLEHLNCSCYHETTDENITFTECDECSFEDTQRKGESHVSLSQPSILLRNESEVKFQDDYENGCDDCNTEEKLLDKNIKSTSKTLSFLECDECSFNSENTPKHEFAENVENNAHRRNITFPECDECTFSTLDEQEINENTKNLSNIDILSKDTSMTKSHDYETDCHDCNASMEQSNETTPDLDNESDVHTRLVNLDSNDRVNLNKSADLDDRIDEVERFTDANRIQEAVKEQTTEMQRPRFMGTIFLTGSGDGGLFGESTGPINLIEEESTVAPPEFSRKRGRSDDTLTYPTEMLNESDLRKWNYNESSKDTTEVAQSSTPKSPNFRSSRKGRLDDTWADSFNILNETNQGDISIQKPETDRTREEIATVSEDFSQRRGRLDDENFDPCDDCDADLDEIMNERNLRNSSSSYDDASITSKTDFEVGEKSSSTLPPERKADVNSRKIKEQVPLHTFTSDIPVTANLPPLFCSSASECNGTLNERCITVNSSPICTCGRAYVRHKVTRKCLLKRIVNTSMKLPGEKFDEDLKDPSSQRYREMKKYATEWMSSLLRNMPNLWPVLSHVEVLKFRPGSLIVDWNIVFAVENESEEMFIKDVSSGFQKALQIEKLRQGGPLNVSDASLISVNSVNPCKADEMNECYCEWKAVAEGFVCHCSEQFRDISTHSHHIEESCQESCSPDYCSFNGHCEIVNDKRICLCSGMYFGRRCDVPGFFVLIVLAVIAVISVALLLIVIFARKCRTRSYRGSQRFRRSQEVGSISQTHDRVSDTIAMEENIGATVSKFAPITTPKPPLIRFTRPTISASITSSFEEDCQFDDSPLSEARSGSATATV